MGQNSSNNPTSRSKRNEGILICERKEKYGDQTCCGPRSFVERSYKSGMRRKQQMSL